MTGKQITQRYSAQSEYGPAGVKLRQRGRSVRFDRESMTFTIRQVVYDGDLHALLRAKLVGVPGMSRWHSPSKAWIGGIEDREFVAQLILEEGFVCDHFTRYELQYLLVGEPEADEKLCCLRAYLSAMRAGARLASDPKLLPGDGARTALKWAWKVALNMLAEARVPHADQFYEAPFAVIGRRPAALAFGQPESAGATERRSDREEVRDGS